MALNSTTYKLHLTLSDTDRGVYETVRRTLARHPSETELRLTARILAFGLWWHERLEFGRGLSDVDEPALWRRSLDGQVEHWIDVGRPDVDRMTRAARHQPHASVLAYGSTEVWRESVLPKVNRLPTLEIAALPEAETEALSEALPRTIDWSLMITDGVLYVGRDDLQHELALDWLKLREDSR
ncbi:YaeQ family protein [Wenzhouxiangella sp. XN79A]|uniref:YaeQ family protein n=1 Tax=Wenzhouxiangella sp. XN79A TaxID=2724193 RepID=UPI00144AAFDF|nr:YaeQ family protein [Wenzhouxiangella sp. XN79A]NKI36528.1 YaeQ family protein [Wenzhouxiangella sp. XN79A]